MRPQYLALALLVAFIVSPAVYWATTSQTPAAEPSPVLSETHNTPILPGVDPIAPAGWDGALVAREFTLEESAALADVVVVGRVASQTSRIQGTTINTDVTVSVEKALKGTAGATLTFVSPGGIVGVRHLAVGGEPQFVSGERVLLFLKAITPGQPLYLLQLSHSKFTLTGPDAVQLEGRRVDSQPISGIENRLKIVLGPNVAIGASGNPRGSTDFAIQQPPNCAPWLASDFPIQHRINEAGAPPSITPGFSYYDIIYRSLLMWQQLPDSYVSFGILGSGTETTPTQNGVNSVFWSNIDNIIPGGVIGLNYCYHDGTRRFESDTILTNSTNYSWDQNPDDGINGGALSVRSVAGHEFGHGIQLDHSADSNALMFASIPIGGNKVLNADDQAGAASLYPLSGAGAPGAPTGLSVTQTSPTSNTLSWTAAAGSKLAYDIERATGSCTAPFRSVNTVAGATTTYVDTNYGFGLPIKTIYCYRVKTLSQGGDSGYSNAATIAPAAPTCPPGAVSLWPNTTTPTTPAVADGGSYELGVKFRADVSGSVCGVKFYKGTGNGGTHTGSLWTTNGVQLATGTFFSETATGWQTMAFSTPVAITANTNYVVSYSDPQGHLAVNANYFTTQYDNGVLHAPSNAASGGNGVWSSTGNFPANSGGGSNYWVDPLFIPDATPSSCTGTTRTVFAQQSVPGTPFLNDTTAYTFGMKFTAEVPGIACGVRFYKGAGNNGAHTGQLWSLQGGLLASVTFTGESASGWQQANFSNPVQISAGTTYAVSYSTSSGLAFNQGQFSQSGVDNAPLHAPSSPSSGGNGLYAFGLNTFPGNSANGTNYWVDVVFQANAGLCGTSTVTVFSPASVPAVPAVGDTGSYELGAKFMSDVGGQVCGVRFYKGPSNGGTHVGRLWSLSGTQLAAGTFVSETATGWQQVLFPSPVQILANTMYIISYSDPQGRLSVNQGQLNNSIDNGPLHLPASSAVGGNGVFAAAGSFPGSASPGNNYWGDLVFAPGSSGGGVSDSCLAGSSSVMLTTSTPVTPSVNDGGSYEFGMKFRSDTNGVACGVRFYKGAGNNGTHTGRLWTTAGALLSSVTFTGETASGWQQAMFATPVTLTAGTTYVVSYTTPQGHPSMDAGAFNNPIDNGILHAPSGAQSGGNGLYGFAGGFPQSAANNNFWVDILFAPTCPCSVFSNNYTPTNPAVADASAYELGMRFKPEQNGFITGVRFYKGAGNGGTHTGRLWRADGALLASATFTGETGTGWQQVSFATPVFVAAGGTYVVSYGDPQGNPAADLNFYAKGVESGPLTAFANSAGGNAVYNSPAGSFPAFSANGNNFWVDAVWVAGCLNCLVVASPPAQATAQPQSATPPPPPGSNQAIPPTTVPNGSQQIRPPTGEQVPPVPTLQPGPTSSGPVTDGPPGR